MKINKVKDIITILIFLIILLGIVFMFSNPFYPFVRTKHSSEYKEMKKMNDKHICIGLTKEQCIKLLGEPGEKRETIWEYGAGYFFSGAGGMKDYTYYSFVLSFDDEGKVNSTSLHKIPGG